MLDLVGQHLGEFEIVAYLGEGAHVHAYWGKQPSKNRDVVIKILKSSLARTQDFVERFKREAQAAVELNHPNVVQVYEYHQEGDLLYIVEAFLTGGSLWDIFRKTPGALPIDKTLHTMQDIAAGLDFAHARGMVHGDIKPENVLYDSDGHAMLSDLGITKDIDQKAARTRDGLAFGNPGYMSPEEWRGEPADARTDIYAVGILLFEMLTGQLPFDNVFTGSLAYTHLMHLVTKPIDLSTLRPDLPSTVGDVIHKAMEKERENRYSTVKAMVDDFKLALKGKSIEKVEKLEKPAPEVTKAGVSALFARVEQATAAKTEAQKPASNGATANTPAPAAPAPPIVPAYERANFWLMILAFIAGFLAAQVLVSRSREE